MNEFLLADREPVALAIKAAARANTLEQLYAEIKNYKGHELAARRPYSASQPTRHANPIMIVTEKPEPEDQETGHPLSGSYGSILRNSLLELGVHPEDVHIAYAVHWTPDNEKAPNNTMIAASRPFLFREIELVKPRAILAPGRHVLNALTNYRGHITPLLGQTLRYQRGEQVLDAYVTWHPAFPMRFPLKLSEYLEQLRDFFERNGRAEDNTQVGPPIPRTDTAQPTGIQGIFKLKVEEDA
jgi:DNA polymerase